MFGILYEKEGSEFGIKFTVPESFEKIWGRSYLCFKAIVKVSHRSDTREVRTESASYSEYSETFGDP